MNKFNLSLDDFSPHPRAGLNFEVIGWCDKLIENFPDIRINLFVPAAYCRLGERPCYLSEYPEWTQRIRDLPYNYSIGYHGFYHRRHPSDFKAHKDKPVSNNDEWQYLNKNQAYTLMDRMMDEFSGKFDRDRTFRPPGWKISEDAVRVLINHSFDIAGDSKYYNMYKDKIPNLHKRWISYNWDLTGPCNVSGDVVAYGHASDWTNNYMNEERFNLITDLLSKEQFDFKWIVELI